MLRDAILSTLAYYDVLDMPLTQREIERYLIKNEPKQCSLTELVGRGIVGQRDGYYYLFDREYLVPLRLRRKEFARRKWDRTYQLMRWLRAVPFLRLAFASGSLSMNNTDEQSDLDIIIVARHGRIWTVRLVVSALLSLLGARRTHDQTVAPDKMCPNHFITDASLAIPFRSLYTAELYANLVPVIVTDHALLERFRVQNSWVFEYLYYWDMDLSGVFEQGLSKAVRKMGEWLLAGPLGRWIERRAAVLQRHRIESRQSVLRLGGHLTYTDNALAFHARSSEAEILQKYESSQNQLTARL